MIKLRSIKGREILDSRGNPTIEVEVVTTGGVTSIAAVPSGASTGTFEAVELRDKDLKRFHGKGVRKAIENVRLIETKLKGKDLKSCVQVDQILKDLDGTSQKSNLGANATLGVSLAISKVIAGSSNRRFFEFLGKGKSLPIPFLNIINGGVHADNELDFQEFMIIPHGFKSFSRAIQAATEVFQTLKIILKEKGNNTNVGDEGGFAPQIRSPQEALDLVVSAIQKAGYKVGKEIALALDVASTELYRDGSYIVNGKSHSVEDMIRLYSKLVADYPIVSIEDPFSEEDWEAWHDFTAVIGSKIVTVGDDLYVTNIDRLRKGIESKASNAILIKPNQIGTLSETIDAVELARKNDMFRIISHRSGETEDTSIAHMAVGLEIPAIKTGSVCRSERTAKYNELLRIEGQLGKKAVYSKLPGFVTKCLSKGG